MEPLVINATQATPTVNLDNHRGVMEIKGVSYEEDAHAFYRPIIQWLDEYKEKPLSDTVLNLYFKYFNTASSKALYEVFQRFAEIRNQGNSILINWFYDKDDNDMCDDIAYFSELVEIPINTQEIDHPNL